MSDIPRMNPERARVLQSWLSESGADTSSDFASAVRQLREQGRQLDLMDLMVLQGRVRGRVWGELHLPESVARFFGLLVSARRSARVLDPDGGTGLLGAWIAAVGVARRVDVVSDLAFSEELTGPLDLPSLRLHVGTLSDTQSSLSAAYDAIVCDGPLVTRPERRSYDTPAGSVELVGDPASFRIADLAGRLAEDGFMAMVMAPKFTLDIRSNSVRENLDKFGLHLAALLTFKPGIYGGSNLAFDLAVITREQHDQIFVAGIPEEAGAQEELVGRLWNRRQGATPSQGWFVAPEERRRIAELEAQVRYHEFAREKQLEPTPFSRAVIEVKTPRRRGREFEPLKEHPDTVYLPVMASTAATTRQENLPEKLKSYLQLRVDPKVVLPEYLAAFLNSPLGQAFRDSVRRGQAIPQIDRSLLKEQDLYLVPISTQAATLEAKSRIHRLRDELTELEARIWDEPTRVVDVIEAVEKVNHEERFEEWIETLPFPLATILRTYHAVDETHKQKYERLLFFFEGLAQFVATVHLSAFQRSPMRMDEEVDELKEYFNRCFSWERPTFGMWNFLVARFASSLRKLLGSGEDGIRVADALYATAEPGPLEMLSSQKLVGLLERVRPLRNEWKGHGKSETAEEAKERHEKLRNFLGDFRSIVGVGFRQYELIAPGKNEVVAGPLYKTQVTLVMGSNPQLERRTVTIKTLPETGFLYLHNAGHDEALKLAPTMRLQGASQPATYFYNGDRGSGCKFVSYHLADVSEVSDRNGDLEELFEKFRPQSGDGAEAQ